MEEIKYFIFDEQIKRLKNRKVVVSIIGAKRSGMSYCGVHAMQKIAETMNLPIGFTIKDMKELIKKKCQT